MRKLRYLLRNINLINIVLTVVLIFFVNYAVLPLFNTGVKYTLPVVKKPTTDNTFEGEKPDQSQVPSPLDYIIIAEQNLFHPERKIPVEEKEATPLQKPDFVLYGTLIADDISVAYLEDMKSPVSTPGRGRRQVALKKNETLSGFTLKEIETDKVLMVRGEETVIVYLDDPKKIKRRKTGSTLPPGTAASKAVYKKSKTRPKAKKSRQSAEQIAKPIQPPAQTAEQPPTSEQKEDAKNRLLDLFKRRR